MILALAVLATMTLSAAPLPAATAGTGARLKAAEEAFDEGKFDGALKLLEPVLATEEDGALRSSSCNESTTRPRSMRPQLRGLPPLRPSNSRLRSRRVPTSPGSS